MSASEKAGRRFALSVRPWVSARPFLAAAGAVFLLVFGAFRPDVRAEEPRFLAGRLLVATPEIRNGPFARTVIYMIRHDKAGAMGLVVNRGIARGPLADLVAGLTRNSREAGGLKGEILVHYGGPVAPGTGFVLHSTDYMRHSSVLVGKRYALTSDIRVLQDIGRGKGPRLRLFAFGYAGWGPGQLESEMRRRFWISVPAEEGLIFGPNLGDKWRRALALQEEAL